MVKVSGSAAGRGKARSASHLRNACNRGLPSCVLNGKVNAVKTVVLSLGVLLLVSYVDYATSDQFLFFVFYFIPVALCAWRLGRPAGLGMAFLSGIAWWLADRLSGHRETGVGEFKIEADDDGIHAAGRGGGVSSVGAPALGRVGGEHHLDAHVA